MKPHLFLTLNHFTVPKTFLTMSLSLLAGAADVRPLRPQFPAFLQVVPGLVLAALRWGVGGGRLLGLSLAAPGCSDGDGPLQFLLGRDGS